MVKNDQRGIGSAPSYCGARLGIVLQLFLLGDLLGKTSANVYQMTIARTVCLSRAVPEISDSVISGQRALSKIEWDKMSVIARSGV
jgi:hypothetical protein